MKVFFYANGGKPRALEARRPLAACARKEGLQVVPRGSAADVIVVLGGDGTMLRAAHEFPSKQLLGLNMGGLGYLARVEERDYEAALCLLANGHYTVSNRSMLSVEKNGRSWLALNEISVQQESSGHAAVLDVASDGRAVARYMADGLVVATPTGSTAYSLAAGGPVLMPDAEVLVLTPLNPHSLASRPIVMRDRVTLTITNRARSNGREERLAVYADGVRRFTLDADEMADIGRAESSVQFIDLPGSDPYVTLAQKLGWSGTVIS